MSELVYVGPKITFPALRDYIFSHKLNPGDFALLHPHDFEEIVHEIKTSGDGVPDLPINVLGVLLNKDTTDTVPIGKVQFVNADKPF